MIAQRAVRGTAIILASSYANMAIGIVYGIIMARLLDPDHFGLIALATFFFSVFDVRGKLGLDYAFIHRQPTTDELIATHWTLQAGAALVTLLLVTITSALLPQYIYTANVASAIAPVIITIAGAMVIEAAGATARAALEKELNFARSTLIISASLLLSYLAAIGLALKGYAYWALVGQIVVNAAFSSIGFWWVYGRFSQRPSIRFSFNREIAGWMLRFGLTLTLGAIATVVLLQFDNFLVGTFVSATVAGYYVQAYKVAQWPTGLVTHVVSRVSLPTYAKLQDDPLRLGKAFEMSLWLILTIASPIALAIFVSAPDFLRLLWGEKWLPSASLLRFLIAYSILRPLLDDTGALFTAIGQPKRVTTVMVAQALTLLLVGTLLTLTLGAIGTALGVGVAFSVGILLTYRFVARTISIDLLRLFLRPLLSALGAVTTYLLIAQVIDLNSLPLLLSVIIKGGIATGTFLVLTWIQERHTLFERVRYIWRLLRGSAQV